MANTLRTIGDYLKVILKFYFFSPSSDPLSPVPAPPAQQYLVAPRPQEGILLCINLAFSCTFFLLILLHSLLLLTVKLELIVLTLKHLKMKRKCLPLDGIFVPFCHKFSPSLILKSWHSLWSLHSSLTILSNVSNIQSEIMNHITLTLLWMGFLMYVKGMGRGKITPPV